MSTMGVIQRGTNSVMVDLPRDMTEQLIEQALRSATPINITAKNVDVEQACCTATLVAYDGETLDLVHDGCPACRTLPSTYCDVSFQLQGEEYMFTTVVLEITKDPQNARLVLDYPTGIQTWQRRRFVRAAVADSAPVYFDVPGDFKTETPAKEQFEGRILNVSQEGLACRMQRKAADHYDVNDRASVMFAIGTMDPPLCVNALVISKMPGGTPGTIIVGLNFEFDETHAAERERLSAALKAYL